MRNFCISVLTALAVLPATAFAADDADLRALRDEVARLRDSYEKRIEQLEKRLVDAESKSTSAELVAAKAEAVASAASASPAAAAGSNAFNPNVSLILSGQYSNLSKNSSNYRITGFHLPGGPLGDITPQRGFSLTESELGISANIDHLFYGAASFAVHPDDTVTTEEAFVQTTALPQGLTLKAGRYYSGIGYLNEQHAHAWDFVDAPLAYQAFLGGQFNNDGVQLRWLAPTEIFLEVGAEVGRGSNYPGTGRNKNGSGASAIYAHLGGDVGLSNSWRAGLSLLTTSPRDRQWDDLDSAGVAVSNLFSGSSRLWIVDGVWKWAPNGNAERSYFKLQGEYLRRSESGTLTYDTTAASLGTSASGYDTTQTGWYVQGVYQFAPQWRAGVRSERLHNTQIDYGSNNASLLRPDYTPKRNAIMLDYNPSEFARIRLQFAQDQSQQGITNNQIFLQYQMSLGAHGAHKF